MPLERDIVERIQRDFSPHAASAIELLGAAGNPAESRDALFLPRAAT